MANPTPPFGWSDDKPDAELHTLQFRDGVPVSPCFSMSDGPDEPATNEPLTYVDDLDD